MPRGIYAPEVVVSTAGMPEEEWLEYRRHGIGGSDAAAILRVSPFATMRDLYYDKLNIASFRDDNANWVAKEVGHLLEELVAKIFHVKTGYRIYQIKKMFRHPHYPFMLADLDYFIELPKGETAILEIKTTNYNSKDHWWLDGTEIVPINYEIQGRHYMCVMNLDEVYYCCLYGNREEDVIIRHIVRDYDFEDEIIALEDYFWNQHVLRRIPPPYMEANGNLVLESAKSHIGPADLSLSGISLPPIYTAPIERYLELKQEKSLYNAQLRKIESEMHCLQGQIITEMGERCSATCQRGDVTYHVSYTPRPKPGILKEQLKLLKEQHPEIYQEYVTVSENRQFSITT